MNEAINELIRGWLEARPKMRDNFDPATTEGQKNIVRRELITKFIDQLRYLRDDV